MFPIEKDAKKATLATTEFQAVVLAGFGNRLYPLTEDENLPKALLPVANKTMIYYQLQWLENAGIRDIMVVCSREVAHRITNYINKVYEEASETEISIEVLDEYVGTVDALRALKDKIKSDFIVLSCDLVTDLPPRHIIDTHRVLNPTCTALFYEFKTDERPSSKEQENGEYIGIDHTKSQLLYTASKADVDSTLPIRMSLLNKFPVLTIHTNLRDAHLYIFKRWVLDLITIKKNISSIRSELIPLLVKGQYREKMVKMEGIDKFVQANEDYLKTARLLSSTSSGLDVEDSVKVIAVVAREGLTARANTVWTYSEVNRLLAKTTTEPRVPATCDVSPKTQVGPDSMVGEGSRIGERVSVKKSVIGAHCTIGKNVKIVNSVVMDYVEIEDNVRIDNTVVCNNAKIMEKATLKDCEVGGGMIVEKDTNAKGEQFVNKGSIELTEA